jgi:uncharacterized Zn finger protein (UPF0148 family)
MNNDIVKKGADFLLKGGTLLSEPCQTCNGLLIKYKEDIICLNCQRPNLNHDKLEKTFEENEKPVHQKPFDRDDNKNKIFESKEIENYKDLLSQINKTVTRKIIDINKLISVEEDTIKQKNNLKILLLYLRIMNKIRKN